MTCSLTDGPPPPRHAKLHNPVGVRVVGHVCAMCAHNAHHIFARVSGTSWNEAGYGRRLMWRAETSPPSDSMHCGHATH
ncbi:hypothetical protein TSMEX_011052 [Taenia solium]|eukprot:TsM_000235400 transcript=TsM_000235400 gene=TsM_000235400